jgi:ornithine carbamoyltransferase
MTTQPKHFLDLADIPAEDLRAMIEVAKTWKAARAGLDKGVPDADPILEGKILALVFEQVSTRTRVSFDVGMRQLGGTTMYLTGSELQLGRGEAVADTGKVLSRYVDAITIRTLSHDYLTDLADNSTVPVINSLTKRSHPCQLMADIMTYEEAKGPIEGATIAWTGDANNNVATSWIHAAGKFGFKMRVAFANGYGPDNETVAWARDNGVDLELTSDPATAVTGVDAVVTDTWVSLGDEEDVFARHRRLAPYQVTDDLMGMAKGDAIFMHCLPAHRGEEMTASVIDGKQSVVWDEAENRLHAQKAVLAWCFDKLPKA